MDILFLRDFRLELIIGLYEWERKAPQPVMIDLEIGLYDHKAGHTDQIGDTIHYGEVAARIQAVVASREIRLVETLGEIIADIVRNEFGAPVGAGGGAQAGHPARGEGAGHHRRARLAALIGDRLIFPSEPGVSAHTATTSCVVVFSNMKAVALIRRRAVLAPDALLGVVAWSVPDTFTVPESLWHVLTAKRWDLPKALGVAPGRHRFAKPPGV
jgi:dihydroneopterin aldolase